jgi:predicted nucleic-acid-binding Zn-ribbon protein
MSQLVTCAKCGEVYNVISRAQAEAQVKSFNDYFDTLKPEQQNILYKGVKDSVEKYERCGGPLCGSTQWQMGGVPATGATLRSIIIE